jgi:hypothetical protein
MSVIKVLNSVSGRNKLDIRTFRYTRKRDTYFSERDSTGDCAPMDAHIQRLMNDGWEPMNSANDTGHVRVGKTLALGALTGGLSLLFGASRTTPTITLTFRRGITPQSSRIEDRPERIENNSDGSCSACGTRLPGNLAFCMKCGKSQQQGSDEGPEVPEGHRAYTPSEPILKMCSFCGVQTVGDAENCARCNEPFPRGSLAIPALPCSNSPFISMAGLAGQSAGRAVHFAGRNLTIGVLVFVGVMLLGWWLPNNNERRKAEVAPVATATTSPERSLSSEPSTTHVVINLPQLAFAPIEEVNRLLGKPTRLTLDHNSATWSEGEVTSADYRRAECSFLDKRLITITYRFVKTSRPTTVADELMASGFPREATTLSNFPPYHADYIPGSSDSNPVKCCGLVFHLVYIPEDLSEISVVFANMNEHFAEWPNETREAWTRAGGPKLSTNPLEWQIAPKKGPR